MQTLHFQPSSDGILPSLPPLSLYVHIPWCVQKCPYCDFNSHAVRESGFDEAAYVETLIRDVELSLPLIWGRRVHSVFLGGGTPSLLSAGAVDTLLSALHARLKIDPDAEITLESNPSTFEYERFAGFRAAGVNRLSVGVQSFDDAALASLGRIHDGNQARRALELARSLFDNFNIDMMYALPQQTVAAAVRDVEEALSYAPTHLSAYHLTLEPNTLFFARPPQGLPDDDSAADMQDAIEQLLGRAEFEHYETSAFCRSGYACQHNLNYWTFGDYLGIGAGAHGKLSFHDGIVRYTRLKSPYAYSSAVAAGHPVAEQRSIMPADRGFEFMMNALRLNAGFAPSVFYERTGLNLLHILPAIQRAVSYGLLDYAPDRIAPTERGRRFLNDLLELFIHEPEGNER